MKVEQSGAEAAAVDGTHRRHVVADRSRGDDPQFTDLKSGDIPIIDFTPAGEDNVLARIERIAPATAEGTLDAGTGEGSRGSGEQRGGVRCRTCRDEFEASSAVDAVSEVMDQYDAQFAADAGWAAEHPEEVGAVRNAIDRCRGAVARAVRAAEVSELTHEAVAGLYEDAVRRVQTPDDFADSLFALICKGAVR